MRRPAARPGSAGAHRRALLAGGAGLLAGCATPLPPTRACAPLPAGSHLCVRERSWHTEIILPITAVRPPLDALLATRPGAQSLAFGFGKRSYMLAEAGASGELLLGVLPGPGVVEVTAYAHAPRPPRWRVPVAEAGLVALSAFLWRSMVADGGAASEEVGRFATGQVFYAATVGYSLAYTCNTWVADGLRAAQLAVEPDGVVFTAGVMAQVARLPGACLVADTAAT